MDKDLISINIVAYNAERTLRNTLNSVSSQQHIKMEVIFINDASTDKTLEIIQEFKDSYPTIPTTIISNKVNLGITKSRNLALSYSKGSFIAVLDSDDVWSSPLKLKSQFDFLNSNPDYFLVGTQANIVDEKYKVIKTTSYKCSDEEIRNKMLLLNQFCHSSILMKNKENLTYDESLYIWEDYDLLLKIGSTHKFANLPDIMVNYLYRTKNDSIKKRFKLNKTEIEIITRYKEKYPNVALGYFKGIVKYILILLNLK